MSLRDLTNRFKKSFSDDEGWFRRGKFTPAKNLKAPVQKLGRAAIKATGIPRYAKIVGAAGATLASPIASKLGSPQQGQELADIALKLRQQTGTMGSFDQGFKPGIKTVGRGLGATAQTMATVAGAPKFALKPALTMAGLSGGLSKLTGGSFAQGAGRGFGMSPAIQGVAGATQPFMNRIVGRKTGVTKPLTSAALNALQGIGIDVSTGQKTTPLSVGIDVATGGLSPNVPSAKGLAKQAKTFDEYTVRELANFSDKIGKNRPLTTRDITDIDRVFKQFMGKAPRRISAQTKVRMMIEEIDKQNIPNMLGIVGKKAKTSLQGKVDVTAPYAKISDPKVSILEGQKSTLRKTKDIVQSSDDILAQAKKGIGTIQEPKKTVKQTANDFYTNWVNRFAPLDRLTKQIETKGKLSIRPEVSPEFTTRQLLGAGGTAELRHKKALRPILDSIDQNKIALDDMDIFLKAKRDIGFEEVGRVIKGSDPVQAKKTIEALGSKYDLNQLEDIAKRLYQYQDEGLNKLLQSGFIDQKGYDAIKAGNKNYVPFQRVRNEIDNYLGLPTKTAQSGQVIKKIEGSDRQILSPIESVIADTYKIESAVAKNRVASSVVGLKDIAPEYADMFKKAQKSGNTTISVWENGSRVHYEVGKEIADVLKGVNEESAGMLVKILSAPARLLRQGATGRNIDFMIPNMFKDQLDAAITSKYGYKPFLDYFRGLGHLINYKKTGSDELVESWMKSGGSIFFENMSGRKGIKEQIESATQKKGVLKQVKDWIIGGIDAIGEFSETPTRLGLFKRGLEATGNPLKAMMESREGTLDFARMGAKMKTANSIIPFLNVGVQGFDKLVRAVKDNPKKVGVLFATYAGIPAITSAVYNNLYHPEELAEILAYVKDSNFVIVRGRTKEGKVDYIKFPKGNVVPFIANPTEELINWMAGNDAKSFREMATSLLSEGLPVIKGGSNLKEVGVRTLGGVLPQAIKPAFEDLLNKSTFKTTASGEPKDIVPSYLKGKPPSEQAYEFTPGAYKAIGKLLNVSPLRAKNFLEGTFAGAIKTPVAILEILDKASKGEKVDPNIIPVVRRFYGETYNSGTGSIKIKSDKGRFEAQATELPTRTKDIGILYKDALSTVNSYGEKKTKSQYGITSTKLEDLQSDFDTSNALLKRIEKEKPEQVFDIQVDVYKSGGGANVEDRVTWAGELLTNVKDEKEFKSIVDKMLKGKVLTKSVVEGLREAGFDISQYTSGGKIKILGGSGSSKSAKKITIKKVGQQPNIRIGKFGTRKPKTLKIKSPPKIRLRGVNARNLKLPTYKVPNIKVAKIKGLQPGIKLV